MTLKMVVPKGKLFNKVEDLLSEIGLTLVGDSRNYRPTLYGCDIEVKLLKSQNIPEMVALGQHDIGFAGMDWIIEQEADVEVLMDLGFNPVRLVSCIPEEWDWDEVKQRNIIVASEYKKIANDYLTRLGVPFKLLRAYGATEVFPPEDADMIIDNTSTGSTIRANRLKIVDTVIESSTQFIANKEILKNPEKKKQIDDLLLLMRGVMNGRKRVLLEMNCNKDNVQKVVDLLPAMRSPTVSELYNSDGFAIKAAIERKLIKDLLPQLIAAGATDILETPIRKAL
ncbi:ATP phosphoribosyltransferase [Kangiella sediminilitoris]|uniref:ATP phosphoribosyltransferase n=1 Tax=Kangiella sediminilitoris TaxID=1144748 RepID=A0A1B3BBR5_9GAMM|nr:ATP phosphoribosyltransferase [Kangiella sediminilitoris]AOE50234.1 ATP phosphoribosyltransferase [Kangiella sediminilitoris]